MTAFAKRTDSYYHITSWPEEILTPGKTSYIAWSESNYWKLQSDTEQQAKYMLRDFEDEKIKIPIGGKIDLIELARSKAKAQMKKETELEKLRVAEFSDRPSRRNCIFLCESENQLS